MRRERTLGRVLLAFLAGLAFGLSLIVAIGAQNAWVLRQGLRREHVGIVVAACAASDAALILAGVAGVGALVASVPALGTVTRLAGAAFLLGYAALALRRALRPGDGLEAADGGAAVARAPVLATTLALTWLNPHVYLDTLVLLGSAAAAHGADRWWFGLGAACGSVAWFTALGQGAQLLRPLFARPGSWRVLDGVVAAIMVLVAAGLAASA